MNRNKVTAWPLRIVSAWSCVMLGAGIASAQLDVAVGTGQAAPVSATPTPMPTETPAAGRKLTEDPQAVKSAQSIVPAAGTELNSTEERSLGPGTGVAGAPAVKFTQDGKMLVPDATKGTSEALAVSSGAQLLKMLDLVPKPAQPGGLESDEAAATSLFDKDAVEKMLGMKPTVVYRVVVDESPLPDPMIIPWIRNVRLIEENFNKAVEKLGKNEVDEARAILLDIVTQFPSSEFAEQATALLKKIEDIKPNQNTAIKTTPSPIDIQLNPNVKIGSVVADTVNPENSRVMIGSRPYKPGDAIRSFPNHRIISIAEDIVVLEVEENGHKKQFEVPVRPGGS